MMPQVVASRETHGLAAQSKGPSSSDTSQPTAPPNSNEETSSLMNLAPRRSILMNKKHVDLNVRSATALKKVTFFPFKGLMAPVFTSFQYDEFFSLEVAYINWYAKWLKMEGVTAVLVNSIVGEGPALSVAERKSNAQAWWNAATKHNLLMMLEVGGASLPDVIELAKQAEELGVHAVLCLPGLFYKPLNVNQLVGYCKIVSRACSTRPFFYCHSPSYTKVKLDMSEFCQKAEERIACFCGIQYESGDLEMGVKCLQSGRIILLGSDMLLASAMLLGFESALMTSLNIHPQIVFSIYEAMKNNDLKEARENQQALNSLLCRWALFDLPEQWINDMKSWFNEEHQRRSTGIMVGPPRKHY